MSIEEKLENLKQILPPPQRLCQVLFLKIFLQKIEI